MEVGGVVRLAAGSDIDLAAIAGAGGDVAAERDRRRSGSTWVNHDGAEMSASGGTVPAAAARTALSALRRP